MTLSVPLAFLAGVAAFFSPCVFPLVPSYVGYVTGLTLEELRATSIAAARRNAVFHALLFGVGFTIVFVGLGVTAGAIGHAMSGVLRSLELAGAAAIMVLGLHLLGVVPIPLLLRQYSAFPGAGRMVRFGSVGVGLTFGAAWTPCVGPLLASLLLYAGIGGHALRGGVLLASFSAGLGLPFLLVAVGFNHYLVGAKYVRRFVPVIERATGVALLLTGAFLIATRTNAPGRAASEAPIATTRTTAKKYAAGYARGDSAASVHVIEFTDFTCPYCREFALNTFPRLDAEFVATGRVRWTLFIVPRPGAAAATDAARAAACVSGQDEQRLWRFHNLVFERQAEWRKARQRANLLMHLGALAGADSTTLTECMAAASGLESRLAAASEYAELMRVRMRPTFLVNGVRVEGALSYDAFRALILSAQKEVN